MNEEIGVWDRILRDGRNSGGSRIRDRRFRTPENRGHKVVHEESETEVSCHSKSRTR